MKWECRMRYPLYHHYKAGLKSFIGVVSAFVGDLIAVWRERILSFDEGTKRSRAFLVP